MNDGDCVKNLTDNKIPENTTVLDVAYSCDYVYFITKENGVLRMDKSSIELELT